MKKFKELYEAVTWTKKWDFTLDVRGNKVYEHYSSDGKWKITLTGYDGVVGKSFPYGSKKTSWMLTDLEKNEVRNITYKTLDKAKKAAMGKY